MNIITCPFCGHKETNKYSKALIYKLEIHILKEHLDQAFDVIMKNNSETVKEEIVKEFMWRYNFFTELVEQTSEGKTI